MKQLTRSELTDLGKITSINVWYATLATMLRKRHYFEFYEGEANAGCSPEISKMLNGLLTRVKEEGTCFIVIEFTDSSRRVRLAASAYEHLVMAVGGQPNRRRHTLHISYVGHTSSISTVSI